MCECCRSGYGRSRDAVVMISTGSDWQPCFDFRCHFRGVVLVHRDRILPDGQMQRRTFCIGELKNHLGKLFRITGLVPM